MNSKKIRIAILAVIALLIAFIGGTYAYWFFTKSQQTDNLVSSACLDILLDNESEAISLGNQFPISDEEGMQTTPYTFTVTNNCNTSIDYQVALESLGDKSTALKASSLKVALDDNIKLYSNYSEVTPIINGAYESRSIGYAKLAPSGSEGSSVTHSLRIWIDYDAPVSEMNKTFESKISVTVGQNVVSPYEEGTLAYDILKNNGGAGVTEIDATEIAERKSAEGDIYIGQSTNYYYGTSYTFDENGSFQLNGDLVQATLGECRNGTKACGKYTTQSTSTSGTTLYEITDWGSLENVTGYSRKYTTSFDVSESIPSLNKTQDDLGESYYFRGAATNNYVQFGAYATNGPVIGFAYSHSTNYGSVYSTLEECSSAGYNNQNCQYMYNAYEPMYWRIVRINGDGTIRLVYDGNKNIENGTVHIAEIGFSLYNEDDISNVNYGDSDIKIMVDEWYNQHLKTNYGSYIADGIFCNDKEGTSVTYYDEEWNTEDENGNPITKENAAYTDTIYAPYDRLIINRSPKLTCTRAEDRYTTNTNLGNGLLTHPVGLLTADEAFLAGGTNIVSNNEYFLYSGSDYYTMTPRNTDNMGGVGALVLKIVSSGYVEYEFVDGGSHVRPVINLRADVEFTGNGSFETPYVITTN